MEDEFLPTLLTNEPLLNLNATNIFEFNSLYNDNSSTYTNLTNCKSIETNDKPVEHNDDLLEVLKEFKLEKLLAHFNSEEITIKRLKYLTENDLQKLFKNHSIGIQSEFRHKLVQWRKKNNYCDVFNGPSSRELQMYVYNWMDANKQNLTPSTCTSPCTSSFSEKSEDFNMLENLKTYPNGKLVLQYLEENTKLNEITRKILVDSIIHWHISKNYNISRNQFRLIANNIEKIFKDDKNIYYTPPCNRGANPKGMLYERYYNLKKRYKQLGIWMGNEVCDELIAETIPEGDVEITEDIKAAVEWLRDHVEPWEEIKIKWNLTFKLRQKEIKDHTMRDILEVWPRLRDSHGFELINMDFRKMYPESENNLLMGWNNFKNRLLPVFNTKIKDKQNMNLLKLLNTDKLSDINENQDVSYILLLHAILPPSMTHSTQKDGKKKVAIKPTIKDSQNSFIIQINNVNDIQRKLDEYATILKNQNLTLQPIIVSIENKNLYYVYYTEIYYKFLTLKSALDCCFKLFFVFNLEYPISSTLVWTLIQKYIYKINLKKNNVTSKILCLIDLLENQ